MQKLHALKFTESTATHAVQMEGVVLNSPVCGACLKAYQENLRLVLGLAAVPGWSAMIKIQWDIAFNNAAVDQWGVEFFEKMQKAPPAEVKEFLKNRHVLMQQAVEDASPLQRSHLEVMTRELDELASNCGEFVHGMFEGVLKTVCIQAWTAVEVLLEDLHMGVIEKYPACFGPEITEKHARTKKNIKGKGGRFGFRSRDAFRESYKFAFSFDHEIMSIVNSKALDVLAVVRHLLVHKAGIVDAMFFDDDLPELPGLNVFASIQKDKPLLFNGEIVRTIVDAAITQGYTLLRAVDKWLIAKHLAGLPK